MLLPNTTHILDRLDVAIFFSLKNHGEQKQMDGKSKSKRRGFLTRNISLLQVKKKNCDQEARIFFVAIFQRLLSCFNPSVTLKQNCFLLIIFEKTIGY